MVYRRIALDDLDGAPISDMSSYSPGEKNCPLPTVFGSPRSLPSLAHQAGLFQQGFRLRDLVPSNNQGGDPPRKPPVVGLIY